MGKYSFYRADHHVLREESHTDFSTFMIASLVFYEDDDVQNNQSHGSRLSESNYESADPHFGVFQKILNGHAICNLATDK